MKRSVVKRIEQRCYISIVLESLLAALIVLAITISGAVFSSSRLVKGHYSPTLPAGRRYFFPASQTLVTALSLTADVHPRRPIPFAAANPRPPGSHGLKAMHQ